MTPDIMENTGQDLLSRLLVIYSPAGGNGKSEIAANLAYLLEKSGKRVWVLDSNIYSPTMDLILNDKTQHSSFIQFLTSPLMANLPVDQVHGSSDETKGALFLTTGGNGSRELRRDIFEKTNIDDQVIERLQKAIIHVIQSYQIDVCVIDTHPGFEQINNVWFAFTSFLLVVSRLNDLDIRNMSQLLQDINIEDIEKKLVIFNNVQYRDDQVLKDIKNEEMLSKFNEYIRGDGIKKEISGSLSCNGYYCGKVEFFPNPILYSKELAIYQKEGDRKSLFCENYPGDEFTLRMHDLSLKISEFFKKR